VSNSCDHALSSARTTSLAPIARGAALLAAGGVLVLLVPDVQDAVGDLGHADAGWLTLAATLELLSCGSYLLLFRPIFGETLSWRSSYRIAMSGLGVNSMVSAGGAGGLALGAWALHREGLETRWIAARSVSLFLLTSLVNFAAVAGVGVAMATGVFGQRYPLLLSLVPAVAAIAGAVAVGFAPRLIERHVAAEPRADARFGRLRIAAAALADGVRDSRSLLASRDPRLLVGIVGYWAFDNAVLLAAFHAFGASPPIDVVLMAYLLGQLGNLLPTPGGVGGADGGTIGMLLAFSVPLHAAVLAVLAYRAWLLLIPTLLAVPALIDLRHWAAASERQLDDGRRPRPRHRQPAAFGVGERASQGQADAVAVAASGAPAKRGLDGFGETGALVAELDADPVLVDRAHADRDAAGAMAQRVVEQHVEDLFDHSA
jgi:uncharacterized membrane protein YbhN (UPF0104 family)